MPMALRRVFSPSVLVALLLLAIGALLRVLALFNEFWGDEILSWIFARQVSSLFEIFTIPYDNNHTLNTIFLYLLGDRIHWIPYRIPALVFGLGTLALAAHIASVCGKREMLVTLLLYSFSFMMVLYSSEARGYAPALFFALLSYDLTKHYSVQQRPLPMLLFWMSVLLGFLSHVSYGIVFFGLLLWMVHRTLQTPRVTVRPLLTWFGVPLLIFVTLFFSTHILTPRIIGSSVNYSFLRSVVEAVTLPYGAPEIFPIAILCALLFLTVCIVTLAAVRREDRGEWLFFVVVLCSPLAILLIGALSEVWGGRYILVPVGFSYLLFARFLAVLAERGKGGMFLSTMLVLLFLIGNGWNIAQLLRFGRGGYLAALHDIQQQANAGETMISSNGYVIPLALQFYERFLRGDRALSYSFSGADPTLFPSFLILPGKEDLFVRRGERPSWLIVQDSNYLYEPGDGMLQHAGRLFSLHATYRYHRESGHDLFVYRVASLLEH